MTLRYINFKIFFCVFILFSLQTTYAQEKKLTITANIDSVYINIDSLFAGITPLLNFPSRNDSIFIVASDEAPDIWSTQKISFPLVMKTDTTINLLFKSKLNLITEPPNAAVYLDNALIGYTPICFTYEYGKQKELKIVKGNFQENIFIDSIKSKKMRILLEPINKTAKDPLTAEKKEIFSKNSIVYLIIGGIASGLISGYTKIKADHFENEYDNKKDESLKNKIHTYDTISNISLIIFESCLLTVNYLLLKD
jgi:hypothetical protein